MWKHGFDETRPRILRATLVHLHWMFVQGDRPGVEFVDFVEDELEDEIEDEVEDESEEAPYPRTENREALGDDVEEPDFGVGQRAETEKGSWGR